MNKIESSELQFCGDQNDPDVDQKYADEVVRKIQDQVVVCVFCGPSIQQTVSGPQPTV